MSETGTRTRRRRSKKKPKMAVWQKILIGIGCVLVTIALIFGGLYAWKADQIQGALGAIDTETKFESTASTIDNTKGILLIGVDDDGGSTIDAGHTDSLTYIGVNFTTQEVIMLPIYRDARIPVACDNNREENINRILQQSNLNCLVESTANFLDLPIDYYVQTSTGGFLQAVSKFGTISVTSAESFCNGAYCFEAGTVYNMNAEMALQYARYRGATSGINRANRQVSIIEGVMNQCRADVFGCFDEISPILGDIVKMNIPITDMTQYLSAITGGLNIEQLAVISGTNTQLSDGWSQLVDMADLATKTQQIRTTIFQ